MTRNAVALAGLVVVLAWAAFLRAQSPQTPAPPTFQVSVNYVDVDVTVTDAQGNFVRGLTRDDFQVLEDGKPQKIDTFSLIEIPIERPQRFLVSGRPVLSDVRSNRQASAGRVYLIVLDDLDVSPLRTTQVRKSARQFVENYFGADDVGAVVCTSGINRCAQEFTSDPNLLIAAIDKFVGQRLRSAELDRLDAFYQTAALPPTDQDAEQKALNPDQQDPDPNSQEAIQKVLNRMVISDPFGLTSYDPNSFERGVRAVGVMDSMRHLAEFLSTVRGRRKALLLFSEGIDYPMSAVFDSPSGSEIIRATEDAITSAAHANVNFFTFDPRGLLGMTTDLIENMKAGLPDYQGQINGQPNFGQEALASEMHLSQDSLRTLAEQTGGFAAVDTNSFKGAFDRIVQSNSNYYLLGYNPPAHPRDGRFHHIEVRVSRPGLKVIARKGYPSPRGRTPEEQRRDAAAKQVLESKTVGVANTSPEVRDLLNSPMQQSGLGLSIQAVPFKGTKTDASIAVAIELDGSRLQFTPKNNNTLFEDAVELSMFSLTDMGKPQRGSRSDLSLVLRPDNYQRVRALGVRANQRITLAPGRYQLRVAARETSGQTGSVFYDITVPDFTKEPLMMSGLLLTSVAAQQIVTAQRDTTVDKLLPAPATTRREFVQNDTLALLTEIYDNNRSADSRQFDVGVRLVAENGQEVFTARDTVANGPPKSWETFAFTRQIPLKDVPPGRYLLRVDAAGRSGNAKPVFAETVIAVVP